MTNYTKTTDFAAKDSLPSGDSGKIIRGSEFETEFDNIATAVNSKSDANNPTFTGTVTIDGLTVNGNTILGNAATDTVTVTADIASNLIPSADDTYNLGAVGAEWNDLFIDGTANIDSLVADTADINGGTVDGVTIGGTTAGAITGTTITGTSFVTSGNMTFGDNDKAVFGAGSDLEIYHNGNHSFITDTGTGSLYIRASDALRIQTATNEEMLKAEANGAVTVYHDNSAKLATTSTGIDVTGTVTTDNLTSQAGANATDILTLSGSATGRTLTVQSYDTTLGGAGFDINASASAGEITLQTNTKDRLRVEATGDISFYEDTGTTAKFFWDASAERLGLGTSSPSSALHISAGAQNIGALIETTNNFAGISFKDNTTTNNPNIASSGNDVRVVTGGIERMRIDSNGNLGIGTNSPNTLLHLKSATPNIKLEDSDGTNQFGALYQSANQTVLQSRDGTSNGIIALKLNNGTTVTEAMRVDSNGNVLVGKTGVDTTNTVGSEVQADGQIKLAADGKYPLELNRLTSDGKIAEFRKDGSTVGSIVAASTNIIFGNDTRGIKIEDSLIIPRDIDDTTADNQMDLGSATSRFKDLYLSGGAYLGGTAAANKLDDYEEGTFTPVVADAASGGNTATVGTATGSYVKIGRLVYVTINLVNITTTGLTGSNTLHVRSLPFTSSSNFNKTSFGTVFLDSVNVDDSSVGIVSQVFSNSTALKFRVSRDATTDINLTVSTLTSGNADISATIFYQVA